LQPVLRSRFLRPLPLRQPSSHQHSDDPQVEAKHEGAGDADSKDDIRRDIGSGAFPEADDEHDIRQIRTAVRNERHEDRGQRRSKQPGCIVIELLDLDHDPKQSGVDQPPDGRGNDQKDIDSVHTQDSSTGFEAA
jgi:hypothetical protein